MNSKFRLLFHHLSFPVRRLQLKFIEKFAGKLPLRMLPAILIFGAAIYAFSSIAHEVIGEQEEEADHAIFQFLSTHIISDALTEFVKGVTWLGNAGVLQTGYALLIIGYCISKRYKRAIEILVIGAGGLAINLAMKYSFQRLRPSDPLLDPLQSFSFPSGHATSGFIFYSLLVYLLWKSGIRKDYKITAALLLILIALLIGFSRIYLRMHYPSDVAAGLAIGLAWIVVAIRIMEHTAQKAKQETVQEAVHPKPGQPAVPAPPGEIREMDK